MEKQLEFLLLTKDDGILVGASHLINSTHWNGELWYLSKEENVLDDDFITSNTGALKYLLPSSVCDGVSLMDSEVKVLVTADTGWLSVYSLATRDELDDDDHVLSSNLVLNNDISRVEHDHSILSVSVSGRNSANQKAVTGGMDCSIVIWDIETFGPETTYDAAHVHHVTCVRFTGCDNGGDAESCSELFASTSLDGYCLLWDKRQKFPAKVLFRYENCGLTAVEWSNRSSNELTVGCEDGQLMAIDLRRPKELMYSSSSFQRAINRIRSYTYDSRNYIAVSANCRTLKVIRCDNESFVDVYTSDKHSDYVRGLTWMKNKNELLACAWDSKITKHYPFKN